MAQFWKSKSASKGHDRKVSSDFLVLAAIGQPYRSLSDFVFLIREKDRTTLGERTRLAHVFGQYCQIFRLGDVSARSFVEKLKNSNLEEIFAVESRCKMGTCWASDQTGRFAWSGNPTHGFKSADFAFGYGLFMALFYAMEQTWMNSKAHGDPFQPLVQIVFDACAQQIRASEVIS